MKKDPNNGNAAGFVITPSTRQHRLNGRYYGNTASSGQYLANRPDNCGASSPKTNL